MIPQDLIEFIERERPEVLPWYILTYNKESESFRLMKADGYRYEERGYDEAAALLKHWLESQLPTYDHYKKNGKHTLFIRTTEKHQPNKWMSKTHDYFERDTWLDVLWQAYKAVKEIK